MAVPEVCYVYKALVERVVDGDTVELFIDTGFKHWWKSSCRLLRIDAPEMKTAEGKIARDFLTEELPVGTRVRIKSAKLDSFGRGLVEIWKGDVNINNLMLESGHALPYKG